MIDDKLPFKVKYARAVYRCEQCRFEIPRNALCIAEVIQDPTEPYRKRTKKWKHLSCAFCPMSRAAAGNVPMSPADISNFSKLRYDDQKRIEDEMVMANCEGLRIAVPRIADLRCPLCKHSILEDLPCICVDHRGGEVQYHIGCFARNSENFRWVRSVREIRGFEDLELDQRGAVARKFEGAAQLSTPSNGHAKKITLDQEVALREQNEKLFKLQAELASELAQEEIQTLLKLNELQLPKDSERQVERLADAIVFGVPDACPQCGRRTLRFKDGAYKCSNAISSYSWCDYIATGDPPKSVLRIPEELLQRFPFLECSVRKRIIPYPATTVIPVNPFEVREIRRLFRGQSVVIEATRTDPGLIQAKLLRLGCEVESEVTKQTFCLISTEDCVKRMTSAVTKAKEFDVIVVSENILDQIDGKLLFSPLLCKIVPWAEEAQLLASVAPPSATSTIPMRSPGVAVEVDPLVQAPGARVYESGGTVYSCVLARTDLSRGINSHHRLQLLSVQLDFLVFHACSELPGHVDIRTHESSFKTLYEALQEFRQVFRDLTGNDWGSGRTFVKKPNYYDFIKLAFQQNEALCLTGEDAASTRPDCLQEISHEAKLVPEPDRELPKSVRELLCSIAENVVPQMDPQERTLGVVSVDQLIGAQRVLTQLQALIGSEKPCRLEIMDACNRFFTIIPHSFPGCLPPTSLDQSSLIEGKRELLRRWTNLISSGNSILAPLKSVNIEVVPNDTTEFRLIKECIDTTRGIFKQDCRLETINVFSVEEPGRAHLFNSNGRLQNHRLVWHGSRRCNIASILTTGLRIGTKNGMFGKALYFADAVGKASNYCDATSMGSSGYLLLCQVALGKVKEATEAHTPLSTGSNSIKGIGKHRPSQEVELNGFPLAMGPMQPSEIGNARLHHNEYVIYDATQVRLKYLVEIRMGQALS